MTLLATHRPQIGDPLSTSGIAIVPLFPTLSPRAAYVTLDQAVPHGLRVSEVHATAGSVGELRVENPTHWQVLLYDGEELLGAKQNRILNVTVLVGAGSAATIPVSCVEAGRWSAGGGDFMAAPHAASPEVRRRKASRLTTAPLSPGLAQSEVWSTVAEKSARLGVHSATGAQSDLFVDRGRELASLEGAFALQPGQSGAMLILDAAVVCLDYLSRPDAFAQLYPKLLRGYLLDAIDTGSRAGRAGDTRDGGAVATAEAFMGALVGARPALSPSVAVGEDVRISGPALLGSGLAVAGELVQLTAFATGGGTGSRSSISRPSRRR